MAQNDDQSGKSRDRGYAEGVYLRVSGGAEAVPTGHGVLLWGANHRPRISQRCITISIVLLEFGDILTLQHSEGIQLRALKEHSLFLS
jgi:hypothetical protein